MTSLSCLVWAMLQTTQAGAPGCAELIQSMEAYRQIDKQFPGRLQIRGNACNVIEFCPDNTCDEFVAERGGSSERLMEYAYLYVYWFSEYVDLKQWRAQPTAHQVMSRVIASSRYKACRRNDEREAARCVLRMLADERRIRVAFVRYDENTRSETFKSAP